MPFANRHRHRRAFGLFFRVDDALQIIKYLTDALDEIIDQIRLLGLLICHGKMPFSNKPADSICL